MTRWCAQGNPAEPLLKVTQCVNVSSRPLCLDYGVGALSSQQGTVPTPTASSNSAVKKAMKKDSVIVHSTQITTGKLNKLDISFVPRTVSWTPFIVIRTEKCELGVCDHSGPHELIIKGVFMLKQCAHKFLTLILLIIILIKST